MLDGPDGKRADARSNYSRLLRVAHTVIAERGTNASLRDIARRAGVGLGTLYRHFPSREALLEALLRERLEVFAEKTRLAASADDPGAALTTCLREYMAAVAIYRGVASSLMGSFKDTKSPLHSSCVAVRQGLDLMLKRAQASGQIRHDIGVNDLFALVNAMAWIGDQEPYLSARQRQLFTVILDGLEATTVRP